MGKFINIGAFFYCWKYNLAKPGTIRYYKELCRNQLLSPEEIEKLSWAKTKKLLAYAYQHVPFYRECFCKLGIKPEDIHTPAEFERFPMLTRQELMAHYNALLSDEFTMRDVNISTTGGSSGVPAKVCHQRNVPHAAMGWRLLDWWGISPASPLAEVYRDVAGNWKSRLMRRLLSFPGRQILLDATRFTVEDIKRFLHDFRRLRPVLLHGYVGAVDAVAEYILDNGLQVPSPKAIWLTSAPITAVQQQRIEKAFGAPVYDQYGCCEIYWLAAECPRRTGLHMFYDCRRFEFVDSMGRNVPDGEYGDIVITDLENYAFPLIRYANGDRGRRLPGTCQCGCNLPLMDKVKGRVSESFILPSGLRLNGEYLTTLFDEKPDLVRQFQVHQKTDSSIELLVVPNIHTSDGDLEQIRLTLQQMVKNEVPVVLEKVPRIEQRGGKLKFVISDYIHHASLSDNA